MKDLEKRAMLELAAKVAGIAPVLGFENGALLIGPNSRSRTWNAFDNDADCFLLETLCGFSSVNWDGHITVGVMRETPGGWRFDPWISADEYLHEHGGDKRKARRYAAVRAAVLMSKGHGSWGAR